MVEIINRQRKLEVDCEQWQKFTSRALGVLPCFASGVTVVFVSDRKMAELNRTWRGKWGTTDVLSFPSGQTRIEAEDEPTLGDIFISPERAAKQAHTNRLSFDREIAQLILHGLLHLCGYNHETDGGEMNQIELQLRQKLRI
jgi:probable rRNA maturation factor